MTLLVRLQELLQAQRELNETGIFGTLFGANIREHPNMERLARAIATAKAAGVPQSAIATAEARLQDAAKQEAQKVDQLSSQLASTLGKLQTAGAQASLAHAGLAEAGLVSPEHKVGFRRSSRGGASSERARGLSPRSSPLADNDVISKLDSISEFIVEQQEAAKV